MKVLHICTKDSVITPKSHTFLVIEQIDRVQTKLFETDNVYFLRDYCLAYDGDLVGGYNLFKHFENETVKN